MFSVVRIVRLIFILPGASPSKSILGAGKLSTIAVDAEIDKKDFWERHFPVGDKVSWKT